MKVFIFSKSSWNVYNFRKNLIKNLLNKKYKVYILCNIDEYKSKLLLLGCNVININFNNRSYNVTNDLYVFFKVIFLYIKIKPNIFLNFNIKPVLIGSFVCKLFNVKSINTITGLGTIFLKGRFLKFIFLKIYKLCFFKKSIVFFHNFLDRKLFIKSKIVNKNQTVVTPGSGVNISHYYYTEYKKKSFFNILFVGRLLWDKGIKEFIDSAKILSKKKFINFKIIGEFADKDTDGVTQNTYKMLLKDANITYIKKKKDIRPHLKWADCVVLPSYREGCPKSLLEASAMGKAILGSKVPGISHIIKNNYNGYLFKVKNSYSLSKSILKYCALNSKKKKQMSKNSRKLSNKFDEKKVINLYLKKINS